VPHFAISRRYEAPGNGPLDDEQLFLMLAAQPLAGKAKYAELVKSDQWLPSKMSGKRWCDSGFGLSGTRLAGAFHIHDFTDGSNPFDFDDYYGATSTTMWWFDWAKPDDMSVRPISHDDFGGLGPSSTAPHGNMIFGQMLRGPLELVTVAIDTTTGKAHQPFEHAYMVPLRDPVPVDDGAFVHNQTEYTGLWFLPNWDWARCLWQPEIGRTMFGHSVDRTANNDLVWVDRDETSESGYALWESRFATKAAELGARQVAALPKLRGGQFAANAGVVLWLDDQGAARIVRRSDGKGWPVPKTKGATYTNVIWVDDEHLWLGADMAEGKFAGQKTNAFIRYDRSVLGELTLSNGLGSTGQAGAGKAAQSTASRKRPPIDPRTIRRTRP
jgi:hypothetical protein